MNDKRWKRLEIGGQVSSYPGTRPNQILGMLPNFYDSHL